MKAARTKSTEDILAGGWGVPGGSGGLTSKGAHSFNFFLSLTRALGPLLAKRRVYINPKIKLKRDLRGAQEGFLSCPGKRKRPF